jgi:hypothetical protein
VGAFKCCGVESPVGHGLATNRARSLIVAWDVLPLRNNDGAKTAPSFRRS